MSSMEFELRRALLLKDEQIRELECSLAEKEALIEELRASLHKFKVICLHYSVICYCYPQRTTRWSSSVVFNLFANAEPLMYFYLCRGTLLTRIY